MVVVSAGRGVELWRKGMIIRTTMRRAKYGFYSAHTPERGVRKKEVHKGNREGRRR